MVAIAATCRFPRSRSTSLDIHGNVGGGPVDKALQVQQILATRDLTLHRVSERSAGIFDNSTAFYIPHNLYHRLARSAFQPTIQQILALSHISGYRLADWLAVFGFDLDAIFRAQWLIPRQGTTLLDSTVYGTSGWLPWLAEQAPIEPCPSIAPLGHFVRWGAPCRIGDLLPPDAERFVYARIGEEDAYARPQFVPGGVVRADTTRAGDFQLERTSAAGNQFFLVEHRSGWTCSRLIPLAKDRVLLHCPQRPCIERELRLEGGVRVLGAIDAEIRPVRSRLPERQPVGSRLPSMDSGQRGGRPSSLRDCLDQARTRTGLSFREASSLSRLVASALSDPLYFAAPGTLSDYEALDTPPRHIQKILTICILYGIEFYEFLRGYGLPLDHAGGDPIPDELMPQRPPSRNVGSARVKTQSRQERNGFLSSLLADWQEIPLFLRFSLDAITGVKSVTLSDIFWVSGNDAFDPLFRNGALAVVNRRAKRPAGFDPAAACGLPLCLLLKRDGDLVCGRCSLDRDILRIHAHARGGSEAKQFRDGIDAEIVGEVTAIARRIL